MSNSISFKTLTESTPSHSKEDADKSQPRQRPQENNFCFPQAKKQQKNKQSRSWGVTAVTNTHINTENSLVHRTGAVFLKKSKNMQDRYHHHCHYLKGERCGDTTRHGRPHMHECSTRRSWQGRGKSFSRWLAMCGIKLITVDVVVNRSRRIRKLKQDMG